MRGYWRKLLNGSNWFWDQLDLRIQNGSHIVEKETGQSSFKPTVCSLLAVTPQKWTPDNILFQLK